MELEWRIPLEQQLGMVQEEKRPGSCSAAWRLQQHIEIDATRTLFVFVLCSGCVCVLRLLSLERMMMMMLMMFVGVVVEDSEESVWSVIVVGDTNGRYSRLD